jgi:hypothetical protein
MTKTRQWWYRSVEEPPMSNWLCASRCPKTGGGRHPALFLDLLEKPLRRPKLSSARCPRHREIKEWLPTPARSSSARAASGAESPRWARLPESPHESVRAPGLICPGFGIGGAGPLSPPPRDKNRLQYWTNKHTVIMSTPRNQPDSGMKTLTERQQEILDSSGSGRSRREWPTLGRSQRIFVLAASMRRWPRAGVWQRGFEAGAGGPARSKCGRRPSAAPSTSGFGAHLRFDSGRPPEDAAQEAKAVC